MNKNFHTPEAKQKAIETRRFRAETYGVLDPHFETHLYTLEEMRHLTNLPTSTLQRAYALGYTSWAIYRDYYHSLISPSVRRALTPQMIKLSASLTKPQIVREKPAKQAISEGAPT